MTNRILFVSFIASIVAAACARSGDRSQLLDTLPHQTGGVEPRLGDIYDSLIQEVRNSPSCVVGEQINLTSGKSTIDINQNIDSAKLMNEFTGEVRGTPRVALFESGSALGYYESLNRNATAVNIVYAVKIDQGGERLTGVKVKEELKALDATELFEKCGDHFITQVNRGGILSIVVSFDFLDETARKKWQGKLKLNGSWGDVAKDITQKIEKEGIESTLTVRVVQIGGKPSQAVLAAKSCTLATVDDFKTCRQKVDELMAYANSSFPQQIDAEPAILNFTTASLQTLGVRNSPTISQEVLAARSELERQKNENRRLLDLASQAKDAGVEVDNSILSGLAANREKIREAAAACFSYSIGTTGINWSACLQAAKTLDKGLTKIDLSRAAVHELIIPATSDYGNSFVNPYSVPIDISYAVVQGRKWRLQPEFELDAAGLQDNGRGVRVSDALSPDSFRGALVRAVENRFESIEPRGRVRLHPGESFSLVMNDVVGLFANNGGSQIVRWRCLNCSDSMKPVPTYRIRIRANQKDGSVFRFRGAGSGEFKVLAYGRWQSSMFGSPTGPDGGDRPCGAGCPAADEVAQVLVVRDSAGKVTRVGGEASFSVGSNQAVTFFMNDNGKSYSNNFGGVEAVLQCINCSSEGSLVDFSPEI